MGSEKRTPPATSAHPENPWLNLGANVLVPVLLLTQGKKLIENDLVVLLVALAFPTAYFAYDYARRGKANIFSIIGFVSVLLTGGVGLFQLSRQWYILKEAAIPAVLGLAVLVSALLKKPLITALVYSPQLFDVARIDERLAANNAATAMRRLLRLLTVLLALSFFLSAALNYGLASYFVRTEPAVDMAAFNAEVGRMTFWSWIIITVPSMAAFLYIGWRLFRGIHQLTGLSMEEALAEHLREKQAQQQAKNRRDG